jgi:hypothetical protein
VWILGTNTPFPGIYCSTTYAVTGEMNEGDVTVNRGPRQQALQLKTSQKPAFDPENPSHTPAEDAFNISIGH